MSMAPAPKRGDVWLVNFDPTVGAEIRKVRPAVVLSVAGVGRLPLRIVVPLTDWKQHYAQASWFVAVPATAANGLSKDSGADAAGGEGGAGAPGAGVRATSAAAG